MFTKDKMEKGFTLIELMTAITIFVLVMTVSLGSILGVFDANRKSKSLKTVLSNLNLAVESMSKEMRFGTNYHCRSSGTVTEPQSCSSGGSFLSFLSSDGVQITYRKRNDRTYMEKRLGTGAYIPITAPEIIIDNLTFYTLGAESGDTLQPKILMKIQGHAGSGKGQTDFTLQTLVSQRVLDI